MAKRLICTAPGKLEWKQEPDAPLDADQVRVESEFGAAKHGTEMAFFKGVADERGPFDADLQLFRPEQRGGKPTTLNPGNMIVGRVTEVGSNVKELSVGDRVCFFSSFTDVATPRASSCWKMPEGMPWQSAVCLDPADFAFAAVRDGHVRIGDAAAIFGLGAIGLLGVQLLKLAGAQLIIAADPIESRRKLAERFGATLTLDPTACDAGLEIKHATAGRGADVVIEYSGAMPAMQAALRGVAYGGNVVAGAFPKPYPAGLDFGAESHLNLPRIIFSRACSQPDRDHPRWDEPRILQTCWRWLADGRLTGEGVVDPIVPYDQAIDAYPSIATEPANYLKLGVAF